MSKTLPVQQRKLTTDHARLEQTHALAGLFSAIPRGDRQRRIVQYSPPGTGETWTFAEFWGLGADDQTVLLTILSLVAQSEGMRLPAEAATTALALYGEAQQETLSLAVTNRTLVREGGWEWSGRRADLLSESIRRLSHVTLDVERNGVTASRGNLMARAERKSDGRILLAVNPFLAQVLNGGRAWARISLEERRELKTDTARLLHAWLSTWLRPGQTGSAGLERLADHVWPKDGRAIPEGTRRRRKHDLLCALREIGSIPSWEIGTPSSRDTVTVRRLKDDNDGGTSKRSPVKRLAAKSKYRTAP